MSLGNRDPAWGPGATVAVDFGDGSPKFRAAAQALVRGQPIEHEYKRSLFARLRVVAAEQDDPFATNAVLLGEGFATMSIRPSNITAAEAMVDTILNARFALALLIAGVVYYWRFHAGKKVFGARSFDYVEAFALSFVVDAMWRICRQDSGGLLRSVKRSGCVEGHHDHSTRDSRAMVRSDLGVPIVINTVRYPPSNR